MKHFAIIALVLVVSACAVNKQKGAIRDARLALAAVGMAVDTTDKVVAAVYADTKPEDTKGYCQQKISAFALRQCVTVLETAADSIMLWERALAVYLARKEGGEKPILDDVFSSEAAWLEIAVQVIAVLDGAMQTMRHFDVPIPHELDYAWEFLYGMTGREVHEPFQFDWGDLKQGVCAEYLPGGV